MINNSMFIFSSLPFTDLGPSQLDLASDSVMDKTALNDPETTTDEVGGKNSYLYICDLQF